MRPIRLTAERQTYLIRILLLLIVAVYGCAWLLQEQRPLAGFALPGAATASAETDREPFFQTRFASSSIDDFVHASSVSPLPDGGFMAVWFAGTREGAPDVDIRGSRFDPLRQEWLPESTLVSRESTETNLQRHIRKLGNPVIALAPNNRLWLFFVSVSVGGWAGSAINTMYSDDGGIHWTPPKRLTTSPFFNISTLVRNSPVFHQDGSIGLPVYHEFLGKFAEYLHLSPDGEIIDKFRISNGRYSLQPTIVPLSEDSALALLRNAGKTPGKVLASFTSDRGQTWSEPVQAEPWNPNSALAAVGARDADNAILVALNNLQNGRYRLSLYKTDAKLHRWQQLKVLDQSPNPDGRPLMPEQYRNTISEKFLSVGGQDNRDRLQDFLLNIDQRGCRGSRCEFEYEYPCLIRSKDGRFQLVYSWNNSLIKHVTFNQAWLEMQQ
jgi:predicted neuraminidase